MIRASWRAIVLVSWYAMIQGRVMRLRGRVMVEEEEGFSVYAAPAIRKIQRLLAQGVC